MLNRLMFCYFIQKKGFLDLNVNYLREKLSWVKTDITEYIGRNTIVPFLMDAALGTRTSSSEQTSRQTSSSEQTSRQTSSSAQTSRRTRTSALPAVWQFLQQSGDRYIYDAVKHGHETPIPDFIAEGIDTTKPNLLERRKR